MLWDPHGQCSRSVGGSARISLFHPAALAAPLPAESSSPGVLSPGLSATWTQLEGWAAPLPDRINGPASAQATLRLFGQTEASVRVTLYRDHHAWCP